MATIIRSNTPIASNDAFTEANTFVGNYWGDLANERMFPLPFWQASQMFQASSSNEIALRVININDPSAVSAKWMVFESAMADSLQDPTETGIYYFVMEDTLFNGPILIPGDPILQLNGMSQVTSTPHNNIIRARLAIDLATTQFFAFFQAAECLVINLGGGGGALTGAKVPSTPG